MRPRNKLSKLVHLVFGRTYDREERIARHIENFEYYFESYARPKGVYGRRPEYADPAFQNGYLTAMKEVADCFKGRTTYKNRPEEVEEAIKRFVERYCPYGYYENPKEQQ